MKRPLRVMVLTSIFPNQNEPAKGIYIFHIVQSLKKYCRVKVVAPVPFFPSWFPSNRYGHYAQIKSFENQDGIEVYHPRIVVPPKVGRPLYGFLYAIFLFKHFKKIVAGEASDIILAYWAYPDGFAAAVLAGVLKKKLIVGARGCDVNDQDNILGKRFLLHWALNRSELVFSVSASMKKTIENLGIDNTKIRVIPNGISDEFNPPIYEKRNRNTILYCGRISSEKGVQYLIEAARILKNNGVDFRIELIGDGPDRQKIQDLTRSFDLMERITFKGEIPPESVAPAMRKAYLLCLPSIREGWPNVVMESLACGCPVVASRVGGVPEIIKNNELGILVPSRDPIALAEALKEGLKRSWDRSYISSYARKRTWNTVAQEIFVEIKNVVTEQSF